MKLLKDCEPAYHNSANNNLTASVGVHASRVSDELNNFLTVRITKRYINPSARIKKRTVMLPAFSTQEKTIAFCVLCLFCHYANHLTKLATIAPLIVIPCNQFYKIRLKRETCFCIEN